MGVGIGLWPFATGRYCRRGGTGSNCVPLIHARNHPANRRARTRTCMMTRSTRAGASRHSAAPHARWQVRLRWPCAWTCRRIAPPVPRGKQLGRAGGPMASADNHDALLRRWGCGATAAAGGPAQAGAAQREDCVLRQRRVHGCVCSAAWWAGAAEGSLTCILWHCAASGARPPYNPPVLRSCSLTHTATAQTTPPQPSLPWGMTASRAV